MAKDDYYVIVYQILAYLYQCLKKGKDIDPKEISADCKMFRINEKYWGYIMVNMYKQGLIEGISLIEIDNYGYKVARLECCQITPVGIAYLNENSFIQKAKDLFKDVKDIVPFI